MQRERKQVGKWIFFAILSALYLVLAASDRRITMRVLYGIDSGWMNLSALMTLEALHIVGASLGCALRKRALAIPCAALALTIHLLRFREFFNDGVYAILYVHVFVALIFLLVCACTLNGGRAYGVFCLVFGAISLSVDAFLLLTRNTFFLAARWPVADGLSFLVMMFAFFLSAHQDEQSGRERSATKTVGGSKIEEPLPEVPAVLHEPVSEEEAPEYAEERPVEHEEHSPDPQMRAEYFPPLPPEDRTEPELVLTRLRLVPDKKGENVYSEADAKLMEHWKDMLEQGILTEEDYEALLKDLKEQGVEEQ